MEKCKEFTEEATGHSVSMCIWESGVEKDGASLGEAQRMEEPVQDIREFIGRCGTGNGAYQVNKLISRKPVN